MFKFIYYTWRNLVCYRHERSVDGKTINQLLLEDDMCEVKIAMSNAFLSTVGLKVVTDASDQIPWYIPLSKIQKEWVATVTKHGYMVGLT